MPSSFYLGVFEARWQMCEGKNCCKFILLQNKFMHNQQKFVCTTK